MSRGSMENARVKKQVTDALLTLLKKKSFSEISVTDIINESGVARASYYRNFHSKEEIIENYMDTFRETIMNEFNTDDTRQIFDADNAKKGFEKALNYSLLNKADLLCIYNSGFGSLLQNTFNRYIIEFAGTMPAKSLERYKLYFISGAVTNILIQWLSEGALEAPREIAQICVDYLQGGILRSFT